MKKKIILICIITLCFLFNTKASFNASQNLELHVVYDKYEYKKGDIISLSFDLPKFANLFSSIIRIEYDTTIFNQNHLNELFYLDSHSIFNNFVVNKKYNENIIYAEAIKESLDDGYYSSYKNNLCKLELVCKTDIKNIATCLKKIKIQVYLFDINNQVMPHQLIYSKKIDGKWIKDELSFKVHSLLPSLSDIFKVENRENDQYMIFTDKQIDLNQVGKQILQIGLYDLITGEYTTFSKIVNIIDDIKPVIHINSEISIKDIMLDNYNFKSNVIIEDNYDNNCLLEIKYYDFNNTLISYLDAIELFKVKMQLKVGYIAKDSSGNISDEVVVTYSLKDTTSPTVSSPFEIKIIDKKINEFNLESYFEVSDNLDLNPTLIFEFYDNLNNKINSPLENLKIGLTFKVVAYAKDFSNNYSIKKEILLKIIDTTSPIILMDDIYELKDVLINKTNFIDILKVTDNDERPLQITAKYFINNEVSLNEFKDNLLNGINGEILYEVLDETKNKTTFKLTVKTIDTISPIIKVNVKEGELYKELSEIKIEVKDNISKDLTYQTFLDNIPYNNSLLKVGKHTLKVIAVDEANNKTELIINFIISDKTYVENLINGNIKLEASIAATVIIGASILLTIIKAIIRRTKRPKNQM